MITASTAVLTALNLNIALLPEASDARTRLGLGRVCFRNARYSVDVTATGTVQVTRLDNDARFLALGLPADPDGPMFDFFGFTTLLLHDGTQLTVHTTAHDAASMLTRPDGVEIDSGDYQVAVLGLGGEDDGALRYIETLGKSPARSAAPGAASHGEWQPLDLARADAGVLAPFGPLVEEQALALFGDGVLSITFMGSFRGAPAYHLRDPDDTSGTGAEQRRLRDQEAAVWRLSLARQGGQLRAWAGVAAATPTAGVGPSWGTPACALQAIEP